MSQTKRMKKREQWAKAIEDMVGKNESSKQIRATNRRIDKKRGTTR